MSTHRNLTFKLKKILMKCCDISNEVRPTEISEPWVDCLLEEYFLQVRNFLFLKVFCNAFLKIFINFSLIEKKSKAYQSLRSWTETK